MQAWTLKSKAGGCRFSQLPQPQPATGEVRLLLYAAALNRRDLWCCEGKYPQLREGCVLGSDGAGVVDACGEGVDPTCRGQSVIINPGLKWGKSAEAQSEAYEILGMPRSGTFAEYVCVPVDRIQSLPSYLSVEQAAALPLAGLTAYRALLRQANLKAGQRILVTGIGGGVAQIGLQIATALRSEVWVTSSQPEKLTKAQQMDAAGGFLYTEEWAAKAKAQPGSFDAVIDGTGGEALNDYLQLLRPAGRLVIYGATEGLPQSLDLRRLFWKQLRIQGSTMGTDDEFEQMLHFVEDHNIVPLVDSVFELEKFPEALDRMKNAQQIGKIVLRCRR